MFITLEGIEGSGKSTQIVKLKTLLEQRGHTCLVTREPGATPIGKKIRALLLDSDSQGILPLTELLLYEADRAQHIQEIIRPALSVNTIVISDRYYDATTVYQGYARGFDLKQIEALHAMVVGSLKPDMTLILDLPVERGLERAWHRIENQKPDQREDRFEKESLSFHEKVRQGYLTLAQREPERFHVIDAASGPDHVFQRVSDVVLTALKSKTKRYEEKNPDIDI
jgi:dTMP kinase